MVWGAAIAAGASLVGSALASRSSGKQVDAQEAINEQNLKMQREFAQEGIRWRVADAKAAGIHPLYALGASLPSYSPSTFIPGETGHLGQGIAQAGDYIGRAVDATRTSDERTRERLNALAIERGELEADLLRSRIALLEQQRNPPIPALNPKQMIPGQADADRLGLTVTHADAPGHVEIKPQQVTPPSPVRNFQEPSPVTDLGFAWTGSGYAPVPSKDVKERMEDVTVPQLMWGWRNNVLPNIPGQGKPPPAHLIPEGFNDWRWSYSKQEWQPHYNPHRARVPVRKGMH